MITQQKSCKKEYSSSSLLKQDTSTYLANKFNRQKLRLTENQSAVMVFKIHSLISRQMSTKFSWIQQKMCEIPIFFLTFTHVMKVVTLAYYLKKEFLNLYNFSSEIMHAHLRRYGETSTDLAANFKSTNQKGRVRHVNQSNLLLNVSWHWQSGGILEEKFLF